MERQRKQTSLEPLAQGLCNQQRGSRMYGRKLIKCSSWQADNLGRAYGVNYCRSGTISQYPHLAHAFTGGGNRRQAPGVSLVPDANSQAAGHHQIQILIGISFVNQNLPIVER